MTRAEKILETYYERQAKEDAKSAKQDKYDRETSRYRANQKAANSKKRK